MLKRLLLVLAAVLFAPLCVELALRASYDPERAAEEIRTQRGAVVAAIPGLEQEETRKGRIPHPYIGWTERNRFQQIARELATFTGGRADETLEVLVVGGSVSGLVGANGAEGIRAGLQADQRFAGRDVVVLNHGHGSFKQPQQVMLVAYLLGLGYRPDVILNVDGFNEVALGMDNVMRDANPLYPHWPQYAPTAGAAVRAPEVEAALTDLAIAQAALDRAAREALEGWALKSAILGRRARARVAELAARCGALQDEVLARMESAEGFDPAAGPPVWNRDDRLAALEAVVAGWFEASRQIDALARLHGITYLHVLQPTLHDPGSKPLTELEQERGTLQPTWRAGVIEGYPRLRAAGAELVAAGVAFRDGSMLFRDLTEEAYYDGCHFRGAGMDVFAAATAEWLLELLPE